LTIALAIIVIAFPIFTIGFLVIFLLAIGLLFIGAARIIHGIIDKQTNLKMVENISFLVAVGYCL
jgi:fumarate reductase subunit D